MAKFMNVVRYVVKADCHDEFIELHSSSIEREGWLIWTIRWNAQSIPDQDWRLQLLFCGYMGVREVFG